MNFFIKTLSVALVIINYHTKKSLFTKAKHDLYYIPILYGSTFVPVPLTTYTLDFRYKTGLME